MVIKHRQRRKIFHLTGTPRVIYKTVRSQFDWMIKVLEDFIGIKIDPEFAEDMLQDYLGMEGYLYHNATYANIPWMICYLNIARSVYGKLVHKDGPLYGLLKTCDDVALKQCDDGPYYRVDMIRQSPDIQYSFILHDIDMIDGKRCEKLHLRVSSEDEEGLPMPICEKVLDIDPDMFTDGVSGERDDVLLKIAERNMLDLSARSY